MRVLIGDMFKSNAKTRVNTVNCVGVMGKGIAKLFKQRYPEMYQDYQARCAAGEVHPGEPYAYTDLFGTPVINFPTKDHWRSSSRLSYIERGLDWFRQNWEALELESVAFPPLGCGNGGLSWEAVGPLMYAKLHDLPIAIDIYAPYGTPKAQLELNYLKQQSSLAETSELAGSQLWKYNPNWDVVLYVLRKLEANRYALPVGRTVYQKICYMLTRSGIDLGFTFAKGEYGPFSEEARDALRVMANCNRIQEERFGKMIRIVTTSDYRAPAPQDAKARLFAERVVDLFCRLHDTSQAEEMATIVYGFDSLSNGSVAVRESALIDYICEWKPHWRNGERTSSIQDSIHHLTMLGWIDVVDSAYRPDAEYAFE